MSRISIAGRIQHLPGPWGRDLPLCGALVEVIDLDPGGTDDVIWSGTSGADGGFSGTSAEWRDTRRLRVWVQDSWRPPRGHWEDRSEPDPGDVLLLKLRVRHSGRQHEVFPFANASRHPVTVPWGVQWIERDARTLVVVNDTVQGGQARYRGLYQFLEASGDATAHAICAPHYRTVRSVNGAAATLAAFVGALTECAALPGVQAVDAILNMHGSPDVLHFADGPVTSEAMSLALQGANLAGRLRLLYNTSCFGDSHASGLQKGGFDAVIGSRQVNCNSVTEYVPLLSAWVDNYTLAYALNTAQTEPQRLSADRFAREQLGFSDADSFKTIAGNAALTIATRAI